MTSIPVGEPSARRQIGNRSLGHQRSLAAPPAALRNPSAHGRSPGSQRIADAAFPGLRKSPVAQKSVGTPLTVAGAATDRRKVYRVPFSPSGVIEGPCAGHVPAWRRVVKWSAGRFRERRGLRTPPLPSPGFCRGWTQTSKTDPHGLRRGDLRAVWGANREVRTTFAAPTTR
jgi:hypothetical protein